MTLYLRGRQQDGLGRPPYWPAKRQVMGDVGNRASEEPLAVSITAPIE